MNISQSRFQHKLEEGSFAETIRNLKEIQVMLTSKERQKAQNIIKQYRRNSADVADQHELNQLVAKYSHHPLLDAFGITEQINNLKKWL